MLGKIEGRRRGKQRMRWLDSIIDSVVKNPPARQETWVRPLGWEDPGSEEMPTHFGILAWEIPWTE